ncbi:MAG: glycosyltransferase family 4 protein, partial [Alphaproteobacteria bacterium]|nr:glycosyltransferase family 4 protein [Alphaproteobacteria bacterium]
MKIAVSYSSVKDKSSLREIFGLQVAVSNWMRAFFKHSKQEKFAFLINRKESLDEITDAATLIGVDPKRIEAYDSRFPQENLSQFNTVFRTDPVPGHLLWQRALLRNEGFAFCGLAHAIAGLEVGDVLEQYCLAPTYPGDAIVSPSHAVKSAIRNFWDTYSEYLDRRFGAKFRCPVRLPIIPLGIDLERFARICTPNKRVEQRKTLGLSDDDIVVLWVGRLSHAIKAHPISMFRAVEEAAKSTGAKIHLIMVGYFVPEDAEPQFRDLAKSFCEKADVQFILSDDPRFPDGLWAAGDIFLSLIDNIQESFGLTPIEAIAANLPRVITDWDGYRDCVSHGIDGFLVRTTQPPAGQGGDIASLLLGGRDMYGGYLAKTALTVAVDYHMAAEAIATLVKNPDLRRSMAQTARQRLPNYDWKNIIPAYEALWEELANERKMFVAKNPMPNWPAIPPQVPDPFSMYASFPTAPLKETDRLSVIASSDEIKLLWQHNINVHGMDI